MILVSIYETLTDLILKRPQMATGLPLHSSSLSKDQSSTVLYAIIDFPV